MPNIAVSFDQMRAVRLSDNARLAAGPHGGNFCRECEAHLLPGGSCLIADASTTQCCSRHIRKDHRDIVWRLAE